MLSIDTRSLVGLVLFKFETIAEDARNQKNGECSIYSSVYFTYHLASILGRQHITELCDLLSFDIRKLYSLARAIRKWNERNNFQKDFDFNSHEEKIIKYLQH